MSGLVARILSLIVVLIPTSHLLGQEQVRIGLYGESSMASVRATLDLLGLPYERLGPGSLDAVNPASSPLNALFIAHDATADSSVLDWIDAFHAGGGRLFTFYVLPERLQRIAGIRQGAFVRAGSEGRFSRISPVGGTPRLPGMRQRSWNIFRAEPASDGVRVAATWLDADGVDTGEPALLVGPAGAHLTHVLLGHDPEGAARLYAALLGHFFEEFWPLAVRGALGPADLGDRPPSQEPAAYPKRARKTLDRSREIRSRSELALRDGRYGEALDDAFEARRLATLAFAQAQSPRAGEFRAVWIHSPFGVSDWGWDRSIETLADAGFNAIVPNMFDAGLTSYPSRLLPVDRRVAERGDQMASLVKAAREHGVEVHAWKVNYNLGSADSAFVDKLRKTGRLQANQAGEEIGWLCPSHPDNFDLELESMLEVVRNYDVDGIHFDYIRYPGAEGCYDDGCRIRFQEQTGHMVDSWPEDVLTGELVVPFQKWRQEQITRLVRAVSTRARRIRPEVAISAAVFSNWPQTRFSIGQDWVHWVEAGYLDFVCPMDYIPDRKRFTSTVSRQVDWVNGRVPLYIGIGAWQIPSKAEVIRQILWTREAGADGFILFQYGPDLAESLLPLLREGLSSESTRPPHYGPFVAFETEGESWGEEIAGVPLYPEGRTIALSAQAVAGSGAARAQARVSLRTLGDEIRIDLGEVETGDGGGNRLTPPSSWRVAPAAGDYRMVAEGKYRDADGKKRRFLRRGPLVRVRSNALMDSLAHLYGPPEIRGSGIPVGVLADAYGSDPLLSLVDENPALAGFRLRHFKASALSAARVLIIPQPLNRYILEPSVHADLRHWIHAGGRVLVTHDMGGIRGIRSLAPEVCRRGTGFPSSVRWRVAADHPAVRGIPDGLHRHSYYDHVTLEAGPAGSVLAEDDAGEPVLVVGEFGEGRYAALGLIPGLGPGDADVPVAGAERQLVEAVLGWLTEGL